MSWAEIGKYATEAFGWIDDNAWAADLMKGAASAAGAYMLQQDQQDWHEEQAKKQREMYMNPGVGGGMTVTGRNTAGVLSGARPTMRDFSQGR